ncbi:hypothetical protein BGY98DRAFT_76267 [Russula aff. rugulosa BPL654]|nr:hypothetical protein BGY98DRAFT_184119 [Russula aff. rugulosa BPL654]KAI0274323.1 hypothetical protein BGY98DRAFT_76267 [Russula aff. rugulosa BPL654]
MYVHHVPRDIQSTLFRLITGHAFTGAYRLKFNRPNLPPAMEQEVACVCGAVPEDTEHVLLQCPLTHHHRCPHLFTEGPIDSLRKVFDHPMRCLGLLRFLEATRVCVKPRTTLLRGTLGGGTESDPYYTYPHAPPHTPATTNPNTYSAAHSLRTLTIHI